ncbi:hypothetical protein O6H91_05G033500 [Diphasiastrum complanatum]|uniref:Uncharacterized protein n=1 Tax=Diphasiastrum complanatum TaxID=34168 RepID=A0ACC2DM24_DIPCM|nr:hypothetical protein O6H91_05G033500 [Diphasiastrum complanatum]
MADQARTVRNKQVILVSYPKDWVIEDNLRIEETDIHLSLKPGCGHVLLQTLWASVDPYLRWRMQESKEGLYAQPFQLGKPIVVRAVSKVIASDHQEIHVGEFVAGPISLGEYALVEGGQGLWKVDPNLAPLSYYLGLLAFTGAPGLTAWAGLNLIGEPKPGDEFFVSAAAGAVGLVVGQLAKLKGCRVVGSVGSDDKVELLKKEFGYDDAFNYKKEVNWDATLGKYFPQGIDIYFENVGGRMLEAVLNHINLNGRIPVCGMLSSYNQEWTEQEGVRNLQNILEKCVKMQGFIVSHHFHHLSTYIQEVAGYLKEGKIKYKEHVTEGLENFAKSFIGMLKGANFGKVVVHISDP